jgi:hypothetical protein
MTGGADQSGGERRRHDRFAVRGARGRLAFRHTVALVDLGLRGAAIETPQRLRPGRLYTLRLPSSGERLALTSRVVWCRLLPSPVGAGSEALPLYRAGLEFEDLLGRRANSLAAFLREGSTTGHQEARLFSRRHFHPHGEAALEGEDEFQITRIGRGGLGAELPYAYPPGSLLRLALVLHDNTIRPRARVVDVERLPGEFDRYRTGMEFELLHAEDERALGDFLEQIDDDPASP